MTTICCQPCRLGHMLRTAVRAKALLALTATATAATAAAIAEVLGIAAGDIVRDDSLRANLALAVTHYNGGELPVHAWLVCFPPASSNRQIGQPAGSLQPHACFPHELASRGLCTKNLSCNLPMPRAALHRKMLCFTATGTEGGGTKRALLRMLQAGGELADAASVIVYCTYQAQCADVAGFLCTRGIVAAAYHAGKPMQVSSFLVISAALAMSRTWSWCFHRQSDRSCWFRKAMLAADACAAGHRRPPGGCICNVKLREGLHSPESGRVCAAVFRLSATIVFLLSCGRSGKRCRRRSAAASCAWWWPLWPSAWGWTPGTCAPWCTPPCRAAPRSTSST